MISFYTSMSTPWQKYLKSINYGQTNKFIICTVFFIPVQKRISLKARSANGSVLFDIKTYKNENPTNSKISNGEMSLAQKKSECLWDSQPLFIIYDPKIAIKATLVQSDTTYFSHYLCQLHRHVVQCPLATLHLGLLQQHHIGN